MAIQDFNLADLDGGNGFRLDGGGSVPFLGRSISDAGDVNGDGFDDGIVGGFGASYVVFGKASGFDTTLDLSSLNGNNGFRLDGAGISSVSNAGDVNGDGFDDVLVGAPDADPNGDGSGSSYVVFGKAAGFDTAINLSSLDGSNGFRLDGVEVGDSSGSSVSNAGDVNGDGFDDVLVGAPEGYPNDDGSGSSYVVFGKAAGFEAAINLSSLDGSSGFRLDGAEAAVRGYSGKSVSSAGDVNGDGFDDVIVGSDITRLNGIYLESSYVVFGKASGFDAQIDLSGLDGQNGFRLNATAYDLPGDSVSSAGDVNGDGFADVIIGSNWANPNGQFSGTSYVVFGKALGFDAQLNLSSLNGQNGFRLDGEVAFDHAGASVSGAGDVNGDGLDDLIVGAFGASVYSFFAGSSYVVFGRKSGFDARIDLSSIDGRNGFRLVDQNFFDQLGQSVSGAGDVNHDGFDDLIVAAESASYVIFGGPDVAGRSALTLIDGTAAADRLQGTEAAEYFNAGTGDDTLIGGGGADKFDGGEGDDVIGIADLDFAAIDGGAGEDTLQFQGNGLHLDLTQKADKIHYIQTFDLQGDGDNTLILTADSLSQIQDSSYSDSTIRGDSGDRVVILDRNWSGGGIADGYRSFIHVDGSRLRVQEQVTVDLVGSKSDIDVSKLDGRNGFRLDGAANGVSDAGDVNGDGFDDVILGAGGADHNGENSGSSYVVFGKASGFDAQMDLSSLDGSNGFRLDGEKEQDFLGLSVSSAGDVNGDGFDDVIVGVFGAGYIVFGRAAGFDAAMNVSSLDGSNGFRLDGTDGLVSNAGDVNGDGFDDVIVGAGVAGGTYASYVVFGKASGFDTHLDLSTLEGSNGFRLSVGYGSSGLAVSNAGDVNGDGFDDVIIGDRFGGSFDGSYSGSSYVVFGKASGFDAHMDLSSLDGNNGFRMKGVDSGDDTGGSVSSAGDVNGDGFDDVIVGADEAGGNYDSGASYVVFGKASGFDALMDLSGLDGNNGFRLDGESLFTNFGHSVSSAGDINGDGFDDLIIGTSTSYGHYYGGYYSDTPSYVIFGKASGFDARFSMDDLKGDAGFRVDSNQALQGSSVSGAGDVNSDGLDDLILNAPLSGSSYVIFGSSDFGGGGDVIQGTPENDKLTGTSAAEIFEAGDGNDRMIGRGGADVFHGGAGNDCIQVADLGFALVDGGVGNDVLHTDGKDLNLDLSNFGDKIHGIETICLYGRGDNELTLTAEGLLNLSDTDNTLRVNGNVGDHITVLDDGWVDEGSRGQGYFHVYTNDEAVLLVGMNVTVDFV